MKRFVKGICLMGMVALLATSCNKNKETSMVYKCTMDPTETHFDQEAGMWDNEENARVYIDATYQVTFEADDEVMLFNIDEVTPANSECAMYKVINAGTTGAGAGSTANLEAVSETISEDIIDAKYAFYPGANVNTASLTTDNRSVFTLATEQTYRENDGTPIIPAGALYMAAKIDKAGEGQIQNDNFAFRNICGILELKFYSPTGKTVTSIELTNKGDMSICGDVELIVPEVEPATMTSLFKTFVADPEDAANIAEMNAYKQQVGYNVANATKTLTLNIPGGKQLATTKAEANSFYFVLRPLALMNGFDVTLNFSEGEPKTIHSTAYNKNTIKPNTFRVFTALNAD
jgi:hypothetical protein